MASTLVNLVKIKAASVGTVAITLGQAVEGYRGVEALINGQTYSYSIQSGSNWEYGRGVFQTAGNEITRGTLASSYSGMPLALRIGDEIAFVALADDFASAAEMGAAISAAGEAVDAAAQATDAAAAVQAAAGTSVPIDVGSGNIGTITMMQNISGASVSGWATATGDQVARGSFSASGAWTASSGFPSTQVWRNISGADIANDDIGMWQRIA